MACLGERVDRRSLRIFSSYHAQRPGAVVCSARVLRSLSCASGSAAEALGRMASADEAKFRVGQQF